MLGTKFLCFIHYIDDYYSDVLPDIPLDDPAYDLELVKISKLNFNPDTPANIINKNLEKFMDKFIFGHLNTRSLNKNHTELKQVLDKTFF